MSGRRYRGREMRAGWVKASGERRFTMTAMITAVPTIEAVATTSGPRAAVWALADASTWSQWGSLSKVEVEGGGQQRVGAASAVQREEPPA